MTNFRKTQKKGGADKRKLDQMGDYGQGNNRNNAVLQRVNEPPPPQPVQPHRQNAHDGRRAAQPLIPPLGPVAHAAPHPLPPPAANLGAHMAAATAANTAALRRAQQGLPQHPQILPPPPGGYVNPPGFGEPFNPRVMNNQFTSGPSGGKKRKSRKTTKKRKSRKNRKSKKSRK